MENLTKVLINLQKPEFADKFSLRYDNDEVILCMQKGFMHIIAGVETQKGIATSAITKGKNVDYRVRRTLPKIVVDHISTIGTLCGKDILSPHMSKLSQRRSSSDEGSFVDIEFKFGKEIYEVIIKDVFEDREYMVTCESFKMTPSKTTRYEITKNFIYQPEETISKEREEEIVNDL